MPRVHHNINLSRGKTGRHIVPIYLAVLSLIFHNFFVAYINSSFLEQFMTPAAVGAIYTIGSAVSVLIFLFISRVLHKVGNYKLTLALLIMNMIAIAGMAFADELRTAVPLFLIHLIAIPLIVFNLDVFMEEQIGNNEGSTGSKRGLLLTLASLVGALTPLFSTMVIDSSGGGFQTAYIISALSIVPIIGLLMFFFRDFSDPEYTEIDIFKAISKFWSKVSLRYVFIANFSLQVFFMLMVVYTPLYLTSVVGLSWAQFGIVMFFAQTAYVILEYPAGIIADKYLGEKEMMGFGFLIIIIATSWMAFVQADDVLVWSLIMFVSRIGAALVEVTTESYFFKQTKSTDAQIISFFRTTKPLGYVLGAMFASLSLLYIEFNLLFIAFAALLVPAMFLTVNIKDSK